MEYIDLSNNWTLKIGENIKNNVKLPFDYTETVNRDIIFSKQLPDLTQYEKVYLSLSGAKIIDIYIDNAKVTTTVSLSTQYVDIKNFITSNSKLELKVYLDKEYGCLNDVKIFYKNHNKAYIIPKGFFISGEKFDLDYTKLNIGLNLDYEGKRQRFTALLDIYNSEGKVIFKREKIIYLKEPLNYKSTIKVKRIKYWLFNNQTNLYFAKIRIIDENDFECDSETCTFGINCIKIFKNFFINGVNVKFIGANMGHVGKLIKANNYYYEYRKLKKLKSKGFNALRFIECPSDMILNICDELGLFVIVDIFKTWTQSNFFESEIFNNSRDLILKNTILQLRSHPCVVAYSMGAKINECTTKEGIQLLEHLINLVKKYDDTRKITAAIYPYEENFISEKEDTTIENYEEFISKLDFVSYCKMQRDYNSILRNNKNRYMLGFNCDIDDYKQYIKKYKDMPNIFGIFMDDIVNFNILNNNAFSIDDSYINDLYEINVFQGNTLDIHIDIIDPITKEKYLYWNNLKDNHTYNIIVYSSAQVISVLRNGEQVGRAVSSINKNYITKFDVEYIKDSDLEVRGYNYGEECFRVKPLNNLVPYGISIENEEKNNNSNYYVFNLEIVNKNKELITNADNEIELNIKGNCVDIIDVCNGRGESWQNNKIKAYKGKVHILLLANSHGELIIIANVIGLKKLVYKKKINVIKEKKNIFKIQELNCNQSSSA